MPLASSKPFPQALLPNPYPVGDTHTAYEHCRRLECREYWNTFSDDLRNSLSADIMQGMTPAVAARVLGHGLLLAPNDAGRNALVRDILACDEDLELLAGLAHLYVYGLIRVCTWRHTCPLLLFSLIHEFQFTIPRDLHPP